MSGPGSSSSHGVYTLTSGIITGSGALTLNGPFVWSGGTLGSAGSATMVTANGGLTISGGGKYLYASLVNGCVPPLQLTGTPVNKYDEKALARELLDPPPGFGSFTRRIARA